MLSLALASRGLESFYFMPVEGGSTKVGLCLRHELALILLCTVYMIPRTAWRFIRLH